MTRLDIETVREKLREQRGPAYWRSLEELAATPEFEDLLHREFPRQASEWPEGEQGVDRRQFLQLASASLALAGLTACTRQPFERIVPYVKKPEEIIPGKPLFYATGMTLGGYALGLLAEAHEGRPTKLEGNPDHPASLGATDLWAQSSILDLYDPDRSQVVTHLGEVSTWERFTAAIATALEAQKATGGAGIRILTETTTSPTVAAEMAAVRKALPAARWHQWQAIGRDGERVGAQAAFGAPAALRYDFSRARVVLTLDADPFGSGPGSVRYSRDFTAARKVRRNGGSPTMNRLYSAETTPTATGSLADHRLPLSPARLAELALAIAAQLGVPEAAGAAVADPKVAKWAAAAAQDLAENQGYGAVVAGDSLPAEIHALVHAINERLGNLGTTVLVSDPIEIEPVDQLASLRDLVGAMQAGQVQLLFILGGNPVYDAPADLEFLQALQKVPTRVHLGLYHDETAENCHWHIPAAHYLEGWGDARAFDGTVTLQQPLIEPLYGGKTELEILALLAGDTAAAHELVQRTFHAGYGAGTAATAAVTDTTTAAPVAAAATPPPAAAGAAALDAAWRKALHDGFVADTAMPARAASVDRGAVARAVAALRAAQPAATTVVFRADPAVYDGRFANNGWLQELPKPFTKLTWDNAVLVAPSTAEKMGINDQDVVKITVGGRSLSLPVWVLPGQAPDTFTVFVGYGRRRAGRVGNGVGFDTYPLRTTAGLWTAAAQVEKTTGHYQLCSTQQHHMIETGNLEGREAEKRELVRVGTVDEWQKNPWFAVGSPEATHEREKEQEEAQLYPPYEYPAYKWGMVIDLGSCTGCNACVIACQSENNVPIVGKEQVSHGREMQWLRIDRYFGGEDLDAPEIHNQPLPCMQCETAPCEVVCPVAATSHSAEGLNDMVYNRCVGTRYCSNNCPYKVRRFNFLKYNDYETPVLKLLRNPDVTVRSRGVMEKCTYCVQRINEVRIEAKKVERRIQDGEIVTACAQACPTDAIVFGDLNDPQARVARLREEPTNYGLLEELNTRPRTTYLAKVRNPNPQLETA